MNSKHQKTLAAIFANPVRSTVAWADIEALFIACGGEVSQGRGSRIRVELNNILATFHRPHPQQQQIKVL